MSLKPPYHARIAQATRAELRQRRDIPELLDTGYGSMAEVAESLADLARINRFLFGVQATLGPLLPRLRAAPKPVTVLDIGTGSGQLSQWLAAWAARECIALQVVATDINPRHLAIAKQSLRAAHGTSLLGTDAFSLPFQAQSVDYVISSLLLHHFNPPDVTQLLAECRRVARRGLVMSDLIRHPIPYLLFRWVVRPLLTRSPITAYDSEASFRRGYTPSELRTLAQATLPSAQVALHPLSVRSVLESWWASPSG